MNDKTLSLYQELVKKNYEYNYRLECICLQLEALQELREGITNNNWHEFYEKDKADSLKKGRL
jgi:hypothetical protein